LSCYHLEHNNVIVNKCYHLEHINKEDIISSYCLLIIMKNQVGTVTISVRVPEELIKRIDEVITNKEQYWNRADLVLCSIRQELYHISLTVSQELNENGYYDDDSFSQLTEKEIYDLIEGGIKKALARGEEKYKEYNGPPKQILIRVPSGMMFYLAEMFKGGREIQDFIRFAIADWVSNPFDISYGPWNEGGQRGIYMFGVGKTLFGNLKLDLDSGFTNFKRKG